MPARYDLIGQQYSTGRKTDPRIEALIHAQLSHAASVLNVGAGTGSYEPIQLSGVSVEPSTTMIRQRAPDRFPVVQGQAEYLPFPNQSFDAVMGVMTIHYWSDVTKGLMELKRVAKKYCFVDDARSQSRWILARSLPSRPAIVGPA